MGAPVAVGVIEGRGKVIGQGLDGRCRLGHDLTAVVKHLYRGADTDRQHEGDDENGNGAAQQRFGR